LAVRELSKNCVFVKYNASAVKNEPPEPLKIAKVAENLDSYGTCPITAATATYGCHLRRLKKWTPHSFKVCVSAPGALATAHSRNSHGGGWCARGLPPPAVGVWSEGVAPENV